MAERKGVPALGWWLMLVGSLRLASVWFGFFNIWALRVAVFSQTESACPPFLLSRPCGVCRWICIDICALVRYELD
jgi:hypothetical protein